MPGEVTPAVAAVALMALFLINYLLVIVIPSPHGLIKTNYLIERAYNFKLLLVSFH